MSSAWRACSELCPAEVIGDSFEVSKRKVFNAPPHATTSSSMVLTDASRPAAGLNTLKFSKSVNSDSGTWAHTSATCNSAITNRSCSLWHGQVQDKLRQNQEAV